MYPNTYMGPRYEQMPNNPAYQYHADDSRVWGGFGWGWGRPWGFGYPIGFGFGFGYPFFGGFPYFI